MFLSWQGGWTSPAKARKPPSSRRLQAGAARLTAVRPDVPYSGSAAQLIVSPDSPLADSQFSPGSPPNALAVHLTPVHHRCRNAFLSPPGYVQPIEREFAGRKPFRKP